MKTYKIIGYDDAVDDVFATFGLRRVRDIPEADMIILTGGADINPKWYGEKMHPRMYLSNIRRDETEVEAYYTAIGAGKDIIGICRGAQLIHALNGNKLWQDVNNHVSGGHEIKDILTGEVHRGTSCHHQMMMVPTHPRGNELYEIVSVAAESTYRETHNSRDTHNGDFFTDDIECLWYPRMRALCYQGHPEYGMKSDTEYFYSLLKRYKFLDDDAPVTPIPPAPRRSLYHTMFGMIDS